MTSIFGTYKCKDDINTWISVDYCPKWGFKEGLRELLQNQRDELVNILGQENIETDAISNFKKKGTNDIYGRIRYDKFREKLCIENKGKLETYNLLLGGTTRRFNPSQGIIGQFGEGLKIAALALLRLNKIFSIINNDQVWRFSLKEDSNFKRNNKPEKCLVWRWEDYSNPENKDKVIIEIRNVSLSEWESIVDSYLWMASKVKKMGIITAGYQGDIILNPEFRNKVYSKGVYVTTTSNDICFGYNMDIELDRDRNCIPDYSSFESRARSIILYILQNYMDYKKKRESQIESIDYAENEMFEKFPEQILMFMNQSSFFLGSNYVSISSSTADFLWELNVQMKRETDKRFNVDKMELAPQPLYRTWDLSSFAREKKLSEDFYTYFRCTECLESALSNSKFYISYGNKFEKFYNQKKVIVPPPEPENKAEKTIKNIISKIRLFYSSFSSDDLVFKELDTEESAYSLNGKYFFSSLLFDNIGKMEEFVFGKLMEMLGYKISDLLKKFNISQKYCY